MKKGFKLEYSYDDGSTDEYFCQKHNITEAKKFLLSLLKHGQKASKIYEYVKGKGWKELNL